MNKCAVCSLLDYQSTHVCMQLDAPFFTYFIQKKNLHLFAMNRCNKMCFCVRLLEWLHWWHTFLCNLLEKHYVIFIISWHCSLGGNFLADTLRYLSWPALSRSWHLAASGMRLKVHSHMRGQTRAGAGGKLVSTQIITCVHTWAVAERRRSGSKNRSARNGSNTQFTAPASKPRAPNHHCPQEMQIRPRPLRVCVNIPAVTEREYQNPPASAPQPLRACVNVA